MSETFSPVELNPPITWTEQVRNGSGERVWMVDSSEVLTFTGRPKKGISLMSAGTPYTGTELDRYICESIKCEPVGPANGDYPCLRYKVTATYRERQGFGQDANETSRGDIRILQIPQEDGTFVSVRFGIKNLQFTLYFIAASTVISALDALQGCVNNNSWVDTVGGRTYSKGTALFESYDCDTFWDDSLGRLQKITYNVSINSIGWNKIPTVGGFVAADIYPEGNFNSLLTVGTRVT